MSIRNSGEELSRGTVVGGRVVRGRGVLFSLELNVESPKRPLLDLFGRFSDGRRDLGRVRGR